MTERAASNGLPRTLPRLIITDLDGTLLPESKELTEKTRGVLTRLAAHGVRIGIATGKFFHLTLRYADELGPETAVVALDGARNRYAEGETFAKGIGKETALALLKKWDAPHLAMFSSCRLLITLLPQALTKSNISVNSP